MTVKSLVSTSKCLAKLQKISEQQTYLKELYRHFMSQVQAMKEKGHPLQGLPTMAPSEKFSDSEERTLTAQSGPH